MPLNSAFESVLKDSGISLHFVAPEKYENRVVAPALQVTTPFHSREIPGGQYKGTITIAMGFATATMTPAAGFTNSVTEPSGLDTFLRGSLRTGRRG